jgi:hypothetical protein
MSTFKRGRPTTIRRLRHLKLEPNQPGRYRVHSQGGAVVDVGECSDSRWRVREPFKDERTPPRGYMTVVKADGRSTSKTRREGERRDYAKFAPKNGRRRAGGGRRANRGSGRRRQPAAPPQKPSQQAPAPPPPQNSRDLLQDLLSVGQIASMALSIWGFFRGPHAPRQIA